MPENLLKVYGDFRGGWNRDTAHDNLLDTELLVAENADLTERGAITKRTGTKPLCLEGTCPAQTGMSDVQVKLAASASSVDDYYNGWNVLIVDGTGEGQKRAVSDYDGATKVATVSAAWETQPDATSDYQVVPDYGAEVELLINWQKRDGTEVLLAVMSASAVYTLYKIAADGGRTSICTVNGPDIGWAAWGDNLYFSDGSQYRYTDGTTAALVRLGAPGAAPTLGHSGSGSPLAAGTYKGVVVFVNALGVESPSSPEASVTIAANEQIDWSDIPTGPAGTTKRRLYRTAVGGTVPKFLYEIPNNTATTYTDTTADADLGDTLVTDNDLSPIAKCKVIEWHPNSLRFFAAGNADDKSALYYSATNDPAYFPATSVVYPTTGDGPISDVSLFGNAVLVNYAATAWVWEGDDPATDATWKKLALAQGTTSAKSQVLTPNSMTFLGLGGIYQMSLGILDFSVVLVTGDELVRNIAADKVSTEINAMPNPSTARAVYDKTTGRYLLAYGDETAGARNNRVLVYDWSLRAFTKYTGLQVNHFCQKPDGTLYAASANNILLMNQEDRRDWDCVNQTYKGIAFKAQTKGYGLDYPLHEKKARRFYVSVRQTDAVGTIDLTLTADQGQLSEIVTVAVPPDEYTSFVWGAEWGLQWGWADYMTAEVRCPLKGLRFGAVLENDTPLERVTVYGMAWAFKPRKPKGVKV